MLSPSNSSWADTRRRMNRLITLRMTKVVPPAHRRHPPAPSAWTPSWAMGLRPVPIISGSPNKATDKVPQMPPPRWTGTAPTASSMRYLSNRRSLMDMTTPPMAPTIIAAVGVMTWQQAVTDTRPARQPLVIHSNCTCLPRPRAIARGNSNPPAPPNTVFRIITATRSSKARVLPPLNPSHPNQRMRAPKMARGESLP